MPLPKPPKVKKHKRQRVGRHEKGRSEEPRSKNHDRQLNLCLPDSTKIRKRIRIEQGVWSIADGRFALVAFFLGIL